jgi:hypothetical protein
VSLWDTVETDEPDALLRLCHYERYATS